MSKGLGGLFGGGGGGGGGKSGTSTTSTNYPAWVSEAGEDLYGRADTIGRNLPQANPGDVFTPDPRVRGLSGREMIGLQDLERASTAWQGDFENAGRYFDRSARPVYSVGADGKTEIDRYINPYTESALAPGARALKRAFDEQQQRRNASAVSRGAFGGIRAKLEDERRSRDFDETYGDFWAKGYRDAYDRAVAAAQAQQVADLRAGGAFLTKGSGATTNSLRSAEGLIRGSQMTEGALDQRKRDINYGNLGESIRLPLSVLQGIPKDVTTTTRGPSGSNFGQTLGGIGSLVSAAGSVGAFDGWGGGGPSSGPWKGAGGDFGDIPWVNPDTFGGVGSSPY